MVFELEISVEEYPELFAVLPDRIKLDEFKTALFLQILNKKSKNQLSLDQDQIHMLLELSS